MRRSALAGLAVAALVAGVAAHAEPPTAGVRAGAARLLANGGLPRQPLELALRAFACASTEGQFAEPRLTLVDFTRPSTERRLWVLDLATGEVLFHELVAHGRASGAGQAGLFSNLPGSKQSSLGLFRTAETYLGKHGYSLRLDGLEPGVNDRARERAIVIHSADYVSQAFASLHGRLGRSWGCPVLDPAVHRAVIDAIRGGTALFAYYPDPEWLASSRFLGCTAAPGPDRVASEAAPLRRASSGTAR